MTGIEQRVAQALREAGFNDDPVDPIETQAADLLAALVADGLVVMEKKTLARALPCTHTVGDECGWDDQTCLCCERDATAIIEEVRRG